MLNIYMKMPLVNSFYPVGRESTRRAAKPKRIPPFGLHLRIIMVLLS